MAKLHSIFPALLVLSLGTLALNDSGRTGIINDSGHTSPTERQRTNRLLTIPTTSPHRKLSLFRSALTEKRTNRVTPSPNYPNPAPRYPIKTTPPDDIESIAISHEVPAHLIRSVISVESSWNEKATRLERHLLSRYDTRHATSYGLMQVMGFHVTKSGLCPDMKLSDLLTRKGNLVCGTRILARALYTYPTTKLALVAYNGGDGCFRNPVCFKQASRYADRVLVQ